MRAGTRQVFTARGQATIPTWEFTVDGYRDPFVYPAVAGAPFPQVRLTPDPGTGLAGVGGWTATSADGLTLSAHETTGGCERPLPGQVYETGTAVVLIGHTSLVTGMACTQELRSSPADFRLSHPLGDRVVLDAYTGRAMALLPPELVGPTH